MIASLLAKPVFHGGHPHGTAQALTSALGLLGAVGLLLFVMLLLRPTELGFSVDAPAAYRALWAMEVLEQPMVDLVLAEAFEERRGANKTRVRRLT